MVRHSFTENSIEIINVRDNQKTNCRHTWTLLPVDLSTCPNESTNSTLKSFTPNGHFRRVKRILHDSVRVDVVYLL